MIFPQFWAEGFRTSDDIFKSTFSKLHSTYPNGSSGAICLSRNVNFYFYSVFERKGFVTWVKNFSSLLTNTFNPGLSLFSIFSTSFCEFWRHQILNEFFLVWKAKASFYQSRILFEDKSFGLGRKLYICFFLHFEQKIFTRQT